MDPDLYPLDPNLDTRSSFHFCVWDLSGSTLFYMDVCSLHTVVILMHISACCIYSLSLSLSLSLVSWETESESYLCLPIF